jgi:peptidoglycan/LPS O-acetylase OafA/YrhL
MRDNAIDSVRGLAVLLVYLYHVKILPAGYIGVDIFFTLSGFLITRSILNKYKKLGLFELIDFYKNRAARLVPALLVIFIFNGFLSYLFITDASRFEVLKSGIFAAAFISNYYLLIHDGYFGVANDFNPFGHFWSLSIEEQFYFVVVPFLITLRATRGTSIFGWGLCILLIMSPPIIGIFKDISSDRLYLDSMMRFWQLFLGVFYAYLEYSGRIKALLSRSYDALGGLIVLFFLSMSLIGFSPSDGLFWIVQLYILALGTLALIHISLNSGWLEKELVLSKLGIISYGFYLYHYPLIVFYRWQFGSIGVIDAIVIFILSYMASSLSYKFIELKFINWGRILKKL